MMFLISFLSLNTNPGNKSQSVVLVQEVFAPLEDQLPLTSQRVWKQNTAAVGLNVINRTLLIALLHCAIMVFLLIRLQ